MVLLVLMFAVLGYLFGRSLPWTTEAQAGETTPPVHWSDDQHIGGSVYRVVDMRAGIVCYHTKHAGLQVDPGGLHCVPVHETEFGDEYLAWLRGEAP